MTTSPLSDSESASSFDRLHAEIRRWIWEQQWAELRDVQNRTISAVLDENADILIAASTAAGKTEAAFLPILTQVADRTERGFSVLYVSPLKALINDQFRRLDQLCERLGVEVVRWHGDAPQAAKQRARRNPRGLILITPESIEAMLIRRPNDAKAMLGSLSYVVVDELHAFLNGPRGLHLSSLLRRIDALSSNRARRLGLSATIGDLERAAAWLNPNDPSAVSIVETAADSPELRLQIRAYTDPADADDVDAIEDEAKPVALDRIADHLFATLRGSNNLAFAGSRRRVEAVADRLRTRSDLAHVPNEFFPHHGSLSKELREELELRLKQGELPTTAVATTTLELGIDIGSVTSIAQVGAPRSISSLRQRLGRSGRRSGVPAVLRIYARERILSKDADPMDRLRLDVVRSVAAVRLLVEKFVEAPSADTAVATVVLHQTLSLITQLGGSRAEHLYDAICGVGPMSVMTKRDYAELLRGMALPERRLLEQAPDGTIMLGETGEQLVASRDFYAIFSTDQEWRLVFGSRSLGTIPISNAVGIGVIVTFAGQRWRIVDVDDRSKVLEVQRHRSGRIPKFESSFIEPVHDRLSSTMRAVLASHDSPPYLDKDAAALLSEGRGAYNDLELSTKRLIASGNDTHVLTWRGTEMNSVLGVALVAAGLECSILDVGVTVLDTNPEVVGAMLRQVAEKPPNISDIAEFVENLQTEKFDEMVPEPILRRMWVEGHRCAGDRLAELAASLAGSGGATGARS